MTTYSEYSALSGCKRQRGFTLVELLVVMAIMVTLSVSMVDIVQHQDNQARFEATRSRLESLRFALAGEDVLLPPTVNSGISNRGQHGYLVDNGIWPGTEPELRNLPAASSQFALLKPVFDQTPSTGSTCTSLDDPGSSMGRVDDAGATPDLLALTQTNGSNGARLAKGWRGSYVPLQVGSNDFVDGWGTAFVLNSSVDPITVASLSSDGVLGNSTVPVGEPDYSGDLSLTLKAGDYRQEIDGWTITLQNLPGISEFNGWNSSHLGASILLFENTTALTNNNWRRISIHKDSTLAIPQTGWSGTDTVTLIFKAATTTANENFNYGCRTWLPPGRHLLVIYTDEDAEPHQGNNETPRLAVPFEVYPRQGTLPSITLSWGSSTAVTSTAL